MGTLTKTQYEVNYLPTKVSELAWKTFKLVLGTTKTWKGRGGVAWKGGDVVWRTCCSRRKEPQYWESSSKVSDLNNQLFHPPKPAGRERGSTGSWERLLLVRKAFPQWRRVHHGPLEALENEAVGEQPTPGGLERGLVLTSQAL